MHCRRLIGSILLIIGLVIASAGCAHGEPTVPLPSSAEYYAPFGILEPDQITVPFPWTEEFGKVWETWSMGRDASGRPLVTVTFGNRIIYSFPIEEQGANQYAGPVTLGGQDYRIVNTWVNTDEPRTGSGWVTLEPVRTN